MAHHCNKAKMVYIAVAAAMTLFGSKTAAICKKDRTIGVDSLDKTLGLLSCPNPTQVIAGSP